MASLERRIAELEQRTGMGDEVQLVIVEFVKVGSANDSGPIETLALLGGGMAWKRNDDESEADFMRRVRVDLPKAGPVVLVANGSST